MPHDEAAADGDVYDGREQTKVKHHVLRVYLERLALIVGQGGWTTINYVDCFSGPWKSIDENLSDTSFSIAQAVLSGARDALRARNRAVRLRYFFIEKDPSAFAQLSEFASKAGGDDEIVALQSEFEAAIPRILDFVTAGGPNAFTFIFIDPTGWTGFDLGKIRPLLTLENSEVLINFMTSYILRFVRTVADARRLFGADYPADELQALLESGDGDRWAERYGDAIRMAGAFTHRGLTVILNPTKDAAHFHLVYATRNAKGLEVFKTADRAAMDVMEDERAKAQQRKREEKSNQTELFSAPALHNHAFYEQLRDRHLATAKSRLELLLRRDGSVAYDLAWKTALEELLVWESDLKAWVKAWQDAGVVEIRGLAEHERVPKRGSSHLLVWVGGAGHA